MGVCSFFQFSDDGIIFKYLTVSIWIFCRHILAALHFNENVRRETQKSKDGEDYLKVTFPKLKLGEEVVREIAVLPTYVKWLNNDFFVRYLSNNYLCVM